MLASPRHGSGSVAIILKGKEKSRPITHDVRKEWNAVAKAFGTNPSYRKMTSLEEDLENVEVTKKKAQRIKANKGKDFGLFWDSTSKSDQFRSKVTEDNLRDLRHKCKFLDFVRLRVLKQDDKPCDVKDGRVVIYMDAMHIGLRFLIQLFFCRVLYTLDIAPKQLSSNIY